VCFVPDLYRIGWRSSATGSPLPGITSPNPLILPDQVVNRLWHLRFNQLKETNEKLVRGGEDIFFAAEFLAAAGTHKLPDQVVKYHLDGLASSPEALHGSFQLYREFGATAAQSQERQDPPPADARPGRGPSREPGPDGRGHDETHRRQRADSGHPPPRHCSPSRLPSRWSPR
jgi:hypothetical protein